MSLRKATRARPQIAIDRLRHRAVGRRGLQILTVGAIGAVLVASAALVPSVRGEPIGSLVSAFGEAALVGATVGGVIDFESRRQFARDIGRDVFQTLFSVRAPRAYVEQLGRILSTDRLTHQVTHRVNFEFDADGEYLVLNVQTSGVIENISPSTWVANDPWLIVAEPGSPGSRLTAYESTRINLGPQAEGYSDQLVLTTGDLASLHARDDDGNATLRLARAGRQLEVPPSGIFHYSWAGTTYFRNRGVLPIIRTHPALRHTIVLTGSALAGIAVQVRLALDVLEPQIAPRGPQEIRYVISNLTLAGTTVLVQWRPTNMV